MPIVLLVTRNWLGAQPVRDDHRGDVDGQRNITGSNTQSTLRRPSRYGLNAVGSLLKAPVCDHHVPEIWRIVVLRYRSLSVITSRPCVSS